MVIVNPEADYSGSGLGSIRIEPSAEALMFAANVTRSFTKWQLIVIDNWVDSLKASGAWSAIQVLPLPMICFVNGNNTALLDSFICFKRTWDSGAIVKCTYATDAKLLAHYKYANEGIERTTTPTGYSDLTKMFRIQEDITTLTTKDSHFMIFKIGGTYPYTPANNKQYFGFNYDGTKRWPTCEQFSSTRARFGIANADSNNEFDLPANATNTWIGYSANGNTMYKIGTAITSYNTSAESSVLLNNPLYFGPIVQNIPIGGVSIGHALTQPQIEDWRAKWAQVVKFL